MASDGAYSSAPLDLQSHSFRLLQVHPTPSSARIQCTLRSYTFDAHPAYTALSYMWGADERYDDIEVNGVPMLARKNLWLFLDKMRERKCDAFFWIDAVCIDQGRVHEVNHQVSMMRDIYEGAEKVAIWLGAADQNSDIGMRMLARWKPFADGVIGKTWSTAQGQSVAALCNRRYWRRMWIIQEIILAKDAIIYCGSKELEWCKFVQMFQDLKMISEFGRALHTPSAQVILDSPAIDIVKMQASWEEGHSPLRELLRTFGHHEASDVRDKVYALVGIADKGHGVVVDYQKSPKEILLDVFCQEAGTVHKQRATKAQLTRFGRYLQEMMKVSFSDDEIETIIIQGDEFPSYNCIFEGFACPFQSRSEDSWKTHCRSHFGPNAEPPRWILKPGSVIPRRGFEDPWAALEYTLNHIASGNGVALHRDHYWIIHMWQKRLIDDLDLEELLAGSHGLSMPPLSRTTGKSPHAKKWQEPVETCGKCLEDFNRPILPFMDRFRSASWDSSMSDRLKLSDDITGFLREHHQKSEKAYLDWRNSHSDCGQITIMTITKKERSFS